MISSSGPGPAALLAAPLSPCAPANVAVQRNHKDGGEIRLVAAPPRPGADPAAALRELLSFHLLGKSADGAGAQVVPALLAPFRDAGKVRYDYPLFLHAPAAPEASARKGPAVASGVPEVPGAGLAEPLATLLPAWVGSFAPGEEQSRALKDNLGSLERHARNAADAAPGPLPAAEVLRKGAEALVQQLALAPEPAGKLSKDLEALLACVPAGGRLLGYGPGTALQLAVAAAQAALSPRRAQLAAEVKELVARLDALLAVEQSKSDQARAPEAMAGAMAQGAGLFDPSALSKTVGAHRGSPQMEAERRKRVEATRETLRAYLAGAPAAAVLTLVHAAELPAVLDSGVVRQVKAADPCAAAQAEFDRAAAALAELFRASRVAKLELAAAYDAGKHGPWLERFDWHAFSREELLLVPPVLSVVEAEKLAGDGLGALSRLLRSGVPVKVIAFVDPAAELGASDGGARLELGLVGVGHRIALVHQSTAARPEHLLSGLSRGLCAVGPALHLLATGQPTGADRSPASAWLHAGAAVEGRAHPLFLYDPGAGEGWSRRFDLSGNPQEASPWPHHALKYRAEGGEQQELRLPVTFADVALLSPGYARDFSEVEPGTREENLVAVEEWLSLPTGEAAKRVPYVWAVDCDGRLHRLAITRRLGSAARDRLQTWRTLQELAGIENQHVIAAEARVRAELLAQAESERKQLEEAHAVALAKATAAAAGQAMERLAAVLLDADLGGFASAPATSRTAAPAPQPAAVAAAAAPAAQAAPAAAVVAEEAAGFDEPFVDTALCTSCNDCTKLNPRLFVYDDNKQARIGDAKAGTFAELVTAAEKCPAKCIHPGKPLNAAEPGLPALVERAKRFN